MSERYALLEKLAQENPGDPFYPYAMALECLGQNKKQEAIHLLKQVQQTFPDYLAVYYILANELHDTGDLKQSLAIAKRGFEIAIRNKETKTANELQSFIQTTLEDF